MKKDQENQVPTNPSLSHNPISLETEEVVVEEAEEAIVKKAASTGGTKTVEKSTIVLTTIEDKKKKRKKSTAQVLDPPSQIAQLDGKEETMEEPSITPTPPRGTVFHCDTYSCPRNAPELPWIKCDGCGKEGIWIQSVVTWDDWWDHTYQCIDKCEKFMLQTQ